MPLKDLWNKYIKTPIVNAYNTTKNAINDYVVEPVRQGMSNAINTIGGGINDYVVEPVRQGMSNAINTIGGGINDYVVEPVRQGMSNAINTIGGGINNYVVEPVKQAFETTGEITGLINKNENSIETKNEDFNINGNSNATENAEKENLLKMAWDREDAIRKETQEREDNAYQRAVEDMRKAGINPNLVGINPANSGGGISSATTLESIENAKLNAYTQEIIKQMELEFNLNENQKDRWTNMLSKIIGAMILS